MFQSSLFQTLTRKSADTLSGVLFSRQPPISNRLSERPPVESIQWNHLELGKIIGEGAFGKVHKAKYLGFEVAVKILHHSEDQRPSDRTSQALLREAEVLSKKRHENIVNFYGIEPFHYCIVTAYYDNHSLLDLRKNPSKRHICECFHYRLSWMEGIAKAFIWLHHQDQCVLHRDIKSSNIFLDRHFTVKVGDFGMALLADVYGNFESVLKDPSNFSMLYQAPEVAEALSKDEKGHSTKSDVYSFGVLMQELLTLENPYGMENFRAQDMDEFNDALIKGTMKPEIPEDRSKLPGEWHPCLEPLVDLMHDCCEMNPAERPDFKEIYCRICCVGEEYENVMEKEKVIKPDRKCSGNSILIGLTLVVLVCYVILHFLHPIPNAHFALFFYIVFGLCVLSAKKIAKFFQNCRHERMLQGLWMTDKQWKREIKNWEEITPQDSTIPISPFVNRAKELGRASFDDTMMEDVKVLYPQPEDWYLFRDGLLAELTDPSFIDPIVNRVLEICSESAKTKQMDRHDWQTLILLILCSKELQHTQSWKEFKRMHEAEHVVIPVWNGKNFVQIVLLMISKVTRLLLMQDRAQGPVRI